MASVSHQALLAAQGAVDPFHTYRSSPYSASNLTTYSGGVFNGISIGSNPNGCLVVVLISGTSSTTGRTVSSGTIGGSAATVVSGASQVSSRGVMSRRIAAGTTTVDIAVTFSGAMTKCVMHVFTIEGALASDTVHHTAEGSNAGLAITLNLNIPTKGVGLAEVYYAETSDDTVAWTGLDETSEGYDAGETQNYGTAARSSMASETGRAITATRGLNAFLAYTFGASWG